MYSTTQSLRAILLTVIVIALGFFSYEYIFNQSKSEPRNESSLGKELAEDFPGREVFLLYDRVNNISLNGGIFASPLFESLVDHSVDLPALPVGRSNPFAPIGRTGSSPSR